MRLRASRKALLVFVFEFGFGWSGRAALGLPVERQICSKLACLGRATALLYALPYSPCLLFALMTLMSLTLALARAK